MLPASEDSAPLGIRMATVGMCSNESGIDSSRTFTQALRLRYEHSKRRNQLEQARRDERSFSSHIGVRVAFPYAACDGWRTDDTHSARGLALVGVDHRD